MPTDNPGFFTRIKEFVVGDTKRTAKSASAMNELVRALNALLAIQGVNGIHVTKAAAGFTIELDDATKKKLGMIPTILPDGEIEDPKGIFRFRGDWVATPTDGLGPYTTSDAVVHRSTSAIDGVLLAGTYIADGPIPTALSATTAGVKVITGATNATPIVITATAHGFSNGYKVTIAGVLGNTAANGTWTIKSVAANTFELTGSVGNGAYTSAGYANITTEPYEDVEANQLYWKTVAKGSWKKLIIGDIPGTGRGSFNMDVALMNGKDMYPQEADICVGGVAMKAMVQMSDPY